jgi:uncharacterized protein YecT (DUF1311 family)
MTPHDKSTDRDPKGFGPDEFSVFMPERAKRPGLGARHVLFAGVAGACALGVGLGLWARPAMSERQAAAARPADMAADMAKAPQAPLAARKLQIVVDDRPAPLSAPIDVLPANSAPTSRMAAPPARAEPQMFAPAPQGLMRVRDVAPPAPRPEPEPPQPLAKPKLAPLAVAALLAPEPAVAKAKPAPHAPAHLAKAAPAPKPVAKPDHRVELARAAAAKAAHKAELVQMAKAEKTAKAAARQQEIQLAKAEAKGRAEARAEAKAIVLAEARDDARKRARLASLTHAFQRLLPHPAKVQPVEVAKLDRKHAHKARHEPKVEQASLKTRHAPHVVEPAYRAHTVQVAPQPRSGLMRVSTQRCASRDPGEALVCADPSLGAADRQLTRAYQGARAAGVPDAQLQRQQQRWIAARSAAAREAPWAVHDVYLARIAELNGLAKDAHGDGY